MLIFYYIEQNSSCRLKAKHRPMWPDPQTCPFLDSGRVDGTAGGGGVSELANPPCWS